MSGTIDEQLPASWPVEGGWQRRLRAGEIAPVRSFRTIKGTELRLEHFERPVHLQFRRFAGCPVCNLHLSTFVRRRSEWEGAMHEIVLFHSSREALLRHAAHLPLHIVADPELDLYRAFGVEASPRALLDPRAWPTIARSVAVSAALALLGRQTLPPWAPEGGNLGLPADFLIGTDGRVIDVHYGRHAADQWSLDEVLERAIRARGDRGGTVAVP